MFSQFPNSWFRSQGRDAAHMAKVADTLKAGWRRSLAAAVDVANSTAGNPRDTLSLV
jgi:galactose-1-phosphate uridylyltransferase